MTAAIEFKRVSLLDRIKQAKSNDELLELEIEGEGYEYASVNTCIKWKKASLARNEELLKDDKEAEPKPNRRAKTDTKGGRKGKTNDN